MAPGAGGYTRSSIAMYATATTKAQQSRAMVIVTGVSMSFTMDDRRGGIVSRLQGRLQIYLHDSGQGVSP